MSESCETYQECCLYFTANSFARHVTELAEKELAFTGLTPSYAYTLMVITDHPGIGQNAIAKRMNLKPSTITRFIDKLIIQGFVTKEQEGRNVHVTATEQGAEIRKDIEKGLENLFKTYCDVLGKETAVKLAAGMHSANLAFEE